MKKTLLIIALFIAVLGFSQSNQPGTIHLNVTTGGEIGFGTFDYVETKTTASGHQQFEEHNGGFIGDLGINYNLKGQYGLSNAFSTGFSYNYSSLSIGFANDDILFNDISDSVDGTKILSGHSFGIEGRWHPINNDKFNFHLYPTIGYTIMSQTLTTKSNSYKGLNFGIGAGMSLYFSDLIGMNFNFGFNQRSLSGSFNKEEASYSITSFQLALGLALRFHN